MRSLFFLFFWYVFKFNTPHVHPCSLWNQNQRLYQDIFEELLNGVILVLMQDGRHGVTFGITPTHTILFVQLGAYFVQICLVSVIFISSLDFTKLTLLQVRAGDLKRNISWKWPGSTCLTSIIPSLKLSYFLSWYMWTGVPQVHCYFLTLVHFWVRKALQQPKS